MNVPNYENSAISDWQGNLTDQWSLLLQQLLGEMQKDIGLEGFVISSVSSDPASVDPPTAGGQVARLESTFGQQTGVEAGTLIFDPYEVNGAILPARNGQLKVLLNDGTFHPVTNT